MQTKNKLWLGGAAVATLAIVAGATGIAARTMAGDSEEPISGPALERASAAALAHTGGGTVTDTEDGDEESRYEVEVTLDDGSQVDVQLDEDFNVVGSETDDPGDDDGDDDAD